VNQILHIAGIVLPVFGVIAFGYACAWTGLLRERVAEGLSDYVYTIAIPLLIFRTLSEARFPDISLPLFLLVAINLPLMMTTASLMLEATGSGLSRQALLRLARNLATNLVLIAFVSGLLAQLAGIRPAGVPKAIIDLIAQSSVPCALFAMGLALRRYGIAGDLSATTVISALKLMVHPLVVWLLVTFAIPLPPVLAGVAVLFAAMPCGINAYLLAERYQAGVPAAAGAVSLSTTLSILSISFWLWMIGI
jgi:malonate transporter and related proteins